jgi:hypothetical protein
MISRRDAKPRSDSNQENACLTQRDAKLAEKFKFKIKFKLESKSKCKSLVDSS